MADQFIRIGSGGQGALAAVNLWTPTFYESVFPFIDLMRSGASGWTPNTWTNADQWLTALPASQQVSCGLVGDQDPLYGYIPPGDYKITSASAATLSVASGTGITNIVSGVGTATFTITQDSGVTLNVLVTNNTGSPINVGDVKVFKEEYEDLLLAGEEFDPIYLNNLINADILRFMDWAGTNDSPVKNLATLQKESHRTNLTFGCMGRLGKRLGKKIWICTPYVSDNRFCSFNTSTNTGTTRTHEGTPVDIAHGWSEGDEVMFYGTAFAGLPPELAIGTRYYVRNPSGADFQLSTTSGGSIIDFTGGNLVGGSDTLVRVSKFYDPDELYEEIARQVYNAYPECPKVYVEFVNENWNFGFDHYDCIREMWAFRAGTSSDQGAGSGLGSLASWAAFEKFYTRDQIIRCIGGQIVQFALMSGQFEFVDPGYIDAGEMVKNLVDSYIVAPYFSPRDGATDLSAGGGPAPLLALGADTATDAQWDDWFDQGIDVVVDAMENEVTVPLAIRNPAINVVAYECGQHIFSTNGRDDDLHLRIVSYLDSAAGAAMYNRARNRIFNDFNVTHFTHYVDAGGYMTKLPTHMGQWGLKFASHASDNPRSSWFKDLPGQQDSGVGNELALTRLMVSGHSLSSRPDEGLGGPLASSLGDSYQWQKQTGAGSTIRGRTGDSPDFTGFQTGDSATGTNDVDYLEEWTTPAQVSGGTYTHLLITERHDLLLTLQFEGTLRHLKLYYDSFMVRSPGARVYLWSCWLTDAIITGSNFPSWMDYCLKMQKVWDAMTARINLTLMNQGAQHRLHNAPMMYILVKIIEQALAGDAPGISEVSDTDTLDWFFNGDGVHIDGAIGHYLFAVVEYMCVFRKSPVGGAYPTSGTWPGGVPAALTAEQANTVQVLAWKFFKEYHQRDEWCPTMEEARDFVSNVAVPSHNSYITGGGASASFFAEEDYDNLNPFYFDPATDEALAGWFPVQ